MDKNYVLSILNFATNLNLDTNNYRFIKNVPTSFLALF